MNEKEQRQIVIINLIMLTIFTFFAYHATMWMETKDTHDTVCILLTLFFLLLLSPAISMVLQFIWIIILFFIDSIRS